MRVHIAAVLPVNTRPHTQLQAQLDAARRVGRRLRLAEGEKRRAELCSPEASGGAARVDAPASVTVVGHVVVKLEENGDDRGAVAGSDGAATPNLFLQRDARRCSEVVVAPGQEQLRDGLKARRQERPGAVGVAQLERPY